jgi:hypothetical protein
VNGRASKIFHELRCSKSLRGFRRKLKNENSNNKRRF